MRRLEAGRLVLATHNPGKVTELAEHVEATPTPGILEVLTPLLLVHTESLAIGHRPQMAGLMVFGFGPTLGVILLGLCHIARIKRLIARRQRVARRALKDKHPAGLLGEFRQRLNAS